MACYYLWICCCKSEWWGLQQLPADHVPSRAWIKHGWVLPWVLCWNSPKQISSPRFKQVVVSSLNIVFHCSLLNLSSNPGPVSSQWQIVTSGCLGHTSFGGCDPVAKEMVSFPTLSLLLGVLYILDFWAVFGNNCFWDGKEDFSVSFFLSQAHGF